MPVANKVRNMFLSILAKTEPKMNKIVTSIRLALNLDLSALLHVLLAKVNSTRYAFLREIQG